MANFALFGSISSIKRLKIWVFIGDAAAVIADTEGDITVFDTKYEPNRTAFGRVTHGVIDKVFHNPLNNGNIGIDKR